MEKKEEPIPIEDKYNVEKKFAEEQRKKKKKVRTFIENPVALQKANRSHLLFHYDHN